MTTIGKKGPLAGVRVVELAHVMAGPVGGLLLADMGADVVKVEKLPGGDDTRRTVPPEIRGESASFMIINRNKRGIAVDLKSAEGVEVVKRLIAQADVVLENYRPGTMEKMGLGYEVLRELNPGLVYCKITGFGLNGPYAQRAGYDLIAQGMSGLMGLTGEGPGRPPVKVGVPVGDVTAGILAATGVLAAYIERLRTGQGQFVDTSLLEASVIHTYWPAAIAFAAGKSPGPMGSAHPVAAPYQAFPTRDGWINIGAIGQSNWERIPGVLGAPLHAQRPALCQQRCTHGAHRGPGADDVQHPPGPHHGRVGRSLRTCRRACRAREDHGSGARRSAGACTRHGDRGRASDRRACPGAWLPHQVLQR
jgi:formyl-CoA transferase